MQEEFDFTPSINFKDAFAAAMKIGNIQKMSDIFDKLCSEVGIQDEKSAGEQLGHLAAQLANSKGRGPEARKL
jgi:hypothetical protein